jgi:hypothetical protein
MNYIKKLLTHSQEKNDPNEGGFKHEEVIPHRGVEINLSWAYSPLLSEGIHEERVSTFEREEPILK